MSGGVSRRFDGVVHEERPRRAAKSDDFAPLTYLYLLLLLAVFDAFDWR